METPVLETLFNKAAAFQACNFIRKKLRHRFSCDYCEIFKNTYFEEHLRTAAIVYSEVCWSIRIVW